MPAFALGRVSNGMPLATLTEDACLIRGPSWLQEGKGR
jgi:hypothetical protein